jgi:hypothetical protein
VADENGNNQDVADERELERALSLLRPAASRIDRDRFLFLAGRASAEPVRPGSVLGRWMWPAATLLSSAAVVVLSVLLVTRTRSVGSGADSISVKDDRNHPPAVAEEPSATDQILDGQISSTAFSSTETSGSSELGPETRPDSSIVPPSADEARALAAGSNYPRLRSFVLAYGINALPEPAPIRQSASDSHAGDEPSTEREMLQQFLKAPSAG